ncbi:MAG: hypothetical protein OEW58_12935 [Gammaproteobacteria bacterium]|nr:hypothetical protein [Gammaproteobacteria bacterium]
MSAKKIIRTRLFVRLEAQYLVAALIAGVIGYLAYGLEEGLVFFGLFFIVMQPFLFIEYLNRR